MWTALRGAQAITQPAFGEAGGDVFLWTLPLLSSRDFVGQVGVGEAQCPPAPGKKWADGHLLARGHRVTLPLTRPGVGGRERNPHTCTLFPTG